MNKHIIKLGLLFVALMLNGCGLKGPLYFPEHSNRTITEKTAVQGNTTQTSASTSDNF